MSIWTRITEIISSLVARGEGVIALFERQDVHHAAAIRAVREARGRGDQLILPASAYAEVLVQPARRNARAVADIDDAIDAIPAAIVPIERAIARSAGTMRVPSAG